MAKQRVAILGGGCASMAAAYYLSNEHHLREHLEITVYQVGWRLGGKGSSGRNAAYSERVEEHGLHVWGGFYYNAFRMIRDVYGQLNRPATCPLNKWSDSFEKYPNVAWQEFIAEEWITWPVSTPTTYETPGEGPLKVSHFARLQMLVGWIKTAIRDWPNDEFKTKLFTPMQTIHPHLLVALELAHVLGVDADVDGSPHSVVRAAHDLAKRIEAEGDAVSMTDYDGLVQMIGGFNRWMVDEVETMEGSLGTLARRLYIIINLGLALVIGLLREFVPLRGNSVIDKYDFAEFLAAYGATPVAIQSAALRGFYDYFFAYQNGDRTLPRISAGTASYHLLRLLCEYKGALFYKMMSGMGDAVFAPLYQLCVTNGVKFKFFHQLENIVPSGDGKSISRVVFAKQADIKDEKEYEPLVFPKNVPSWPSEPLYDQIVQGEELKALKVNLEDPWNDWNNTGTVVLEADKDFDAVILGVSIGAFPLVCGDILATNPEWATMAENLQTIQTQALQLWWKPTVTELGWSGGNVTGTANAQPLESWSDMSQAIAVENWPPDLTPGSLIFFCGPQLNPPQMPPKGKDPRYGAEQTKLAWENVLAWTQAHIRHLYPNAVNEDGSVKWDLLVDPYNSAGVDRFRAQFAKSNYPPSDRYVLDLPNTNQYRLEANTSGYTNLALAGDWLYTGLGGSVEGAVIAGMQAARALAGRISVEIAGEVKSPWPRPVSVKPLLSGWDEFL